MAHTARAPRAAGILASSLTPEITLFTVLGTHEEAPWASWTTSGGAMMSATTVPVTALRYCGQRRRCRPLDSAGGAGKGRGTQHSTYITGRYQELELGRRQ